MKREEVYLIDLSGAGFRCGKPPKHLTANCLQRKMINAVRLWKQI